MITLVIGVAILLYTFWCIRSEEADPFWFISYLDFIEVTRMENPYVFWLTITVQFVVSGGMIIYGIFEII